MYVQYICKMFHETRLFGYLVLNNVDETRCRMEGQTTTEMINTSKYTTLFVPRTYVPSLGPELALNLQEGTYVTKEYISRGTATKFRYAPSKEHPRKSSSSFNS